MSPDDLKRAEAIQSTVVTDGWKHLLDDVQNKVEQLKHELTNPNVTLDLLRLAQGRIIVYNEMLSLRALIENALDQHKEDEADKVAEDE